LRGKCDAAWGPAGAVGVERGEKREGEGGGEDHQSLTKLSSARVAQGEEEGGRGKGEKKEKGKTGNALCRLKS